jgi:hypothetical protein
MLGGASPSGTHVFVDTGDGVREVVLGPSAFLDENGFAFAQGDDLEVTGSATRCCGAQPVLAREIRKGERTLTLRDAAGRPAWGGRSRR